MRLLWPITCLSLALAGPLPLLPRDSLAMQAQMGRDMKSDLPGMGLLGFGDVVKTVTRFTPDNNRYNIYTERTYDEGDRPNLGYMDRETTGARSAGSKTLMNVPGVGKFEYAEEREQGTGVLDYSKSLFPFLQLPPLKETRSSRLATAPQALFDIDEIRKLKAEQVPTTARPFSPFAPSLITEEMLPESERPPPAFQDVPSIVDAAAPVPAAHPHGFDRQEQPRPDLVSRLAADFLSANSVNDHELEQPEIETPRRSPAASEWIRAAYRSQSANREIRRKQVRHDLNMLKAVYGAPAAELGIDAKGLRALCARFSPLAQQQCSSKPIALEYVDKCRGFEYDCHEYLMESKPLGAIAGLFSSGAGMTSQSWGLNGIPYYPINEEGSVGGGEHSKLDFGSYGGGLSYNRGMRDLFTQSGEGGANWYEGVYGSKTGWSVPVAQKLGVEGGGGTMLTIPIKEGEFGRPMEASHGYHVGPYIGASEKVALDWRDGGVSMNRGFAVPIAGVSVNTGTGFGFPGAAKIVQMWSAMDPQAWASEMMRKAAASAEGEGEAVRERRPRG